MRLIDADAALRSLSDDLPYKGIARRVLTQAQTVDAVQVTRCMDCESARELTKHESIYLADGVLICTNCEVSEGCRLPVWPQHFCIFADTAGKRTAAKKTLLKPRRLSDVKTACIGYPARTSARAGNGARC